METTDGPDGLRLAVGSLDDFTVARVYDLLALRTDVFVVEQACAYPELDGRDREPGSRHWLLVRPDTDTVVAALRCLRDRVGEDRVRRIGRVVTRPDHRGRGLSRWLVERTVAAQDVPVVLDAQEHLQDWYAALGFRRTGPGWLEDGIPHVPMRHDPPG